MRLAQQRVEAVVEAGAQAGVGGVAGVGVLRDLVVPARRRVDAARTPLVGGAGLEVAVLQGGEQGRRVAVRRAVAVQAAGAAVAGDLDTAAAQKHSAPRPQLGPTLSPSWPEAARNQVQTLWYSFTFLVTFYYYFLYFNSQNLDATICTFHFLILLLL